MLVQREIQIYWGLCRFFSLAMENRIDFFPQLRVTNLFAKHPLVIKRGNGKLIKYIVDFP